MKKKILIIILPIVLVLIVLTGILLYVYLPPKDSNFRIDLQVDDIGFDDEITLVFGRQIGQHGPFLQNGKNAQFSAAFHAQGQERI